MTSGEIILSVTAFVLGSAGIVYAIYLGRVSGRGRPRDPERLRRFIANAPYEQTRPSGRKAGRSGPSPKK